MCYLATRGITTSFTCACSKITIFCNIWSVFCSMNKQHLGNMCYAVGGTAIIKPSPEVARLLGAADCVPAFYRLLSADNQLFYASQYDRVKKETVIYHWIYRWKWTFTYVWTNPIFYPKCWRPCGCCEDFCHFWKCSRSLSAYLRLTQFLPNSCLSIEHHSTGSCDKDQRENIFLLAYIAVI